MPRMRIPFWIIAGLSIPVLLLGEQLVRRVGVLSRFNIPAPVVGGLLVSLLILACNLFGSPVTLDPNVSAKALTWLVLPETRWWAGPAVDVSRPFLIGFFACIGLNASRLLVRRASWQLPRFLAIAALLTMIQNAVGVGAAYVLGENPILGLICGSVSLSGGHGTALGFADVLVKAGYASASVVGVAAATFGLVSAGLLGGPVGGRIIRARGLTPEKASPRSDVSTTEPAEEDQLPAGILAALGQIVSRGRPAWTNLVILLVCIKVGAWVSLGIERAGLTFPVYIGAMLVGIAMRNVSDSLRRPVVTTHDVNLLGSTCLALFLAMAMMGLNLIDLASSAVSMLVILGFQVMVMAIYARWVTFNVMGRDYDSAVMAAGHCGFGLGATPAAVANMMALSEEYGPAPRAFLVLPLVGAFLIDFVNALVITGYLNLIG